MKQLKLTIVLMLVSIYIYAGQIELSINSGWQFRKTDQKNWHEAQVPGTVHTDLWKNKVIDNPYSSLNHVKQEWIKESNWEYKTVFHASSELVAKDKILLDFKGLDTYADVFLNDSLILEADNMFRSWLVDVDGIVRSGDNELLIIFYSPIHQVREVIEKLNYEKPADSTIYSESGLGLFSRKAAYHFGSDGQQGILTSGIWKPIYLRAWDIASIEEFNIRQSSVDDKAAQMIVDLQYLVSRPTIADLEVFVDGESVKKAKLELSHGQNNHNLAFTIKKPALWWPNGHGQQKRYEISLVLSKDGEIINLQKTKIALRTVELMQEKVKGENKYYLRVNGKRIPIKGAEYVPQDYFLPRIKFDQYDHFLQIAVESNMNMIRVSGSGIYEMDEFYDLCDEKGLLVWQNFMFSSKTYMFGDDFKANLKLEAIENIKRLNHHPSIALWGLNNYSYKNENDISDHIVSEYGKQLEKQGISVQSQSRLFEQTISEIVKEHGNGVAFWESTSSNTAVGFTSHSFDEYTISSLSDWKQFIIDGSTNEFGVQSYPAFSTIKTYPNDGQWETTEKMVTALSQISKAKTNGVESAAKFFNNPKDVPSQVYLSQLTQAEIIKTYIDAYRMSQPINLGIMLWQFNETWPAFSYSLVDYKGVAKPALHYIKRSFEPLITIFEVSEKDVKIHASSDLQGDLEGTLVVQLSNFNGKTLYTQQKEIKVKPSTNQVVWKAISKDLLKKQKTNEVYLIVKIYAGEQLVSENFHLFTPYKELNLLKPNINLEFVETGSNLQVKLSSDKTAFGVCFEAAELNIKYSDNFFVLHADEPKIIELESNHEFTEIKNSLSVKSLIDSYEP